MISPLKFVGGISRLGTNYVSIRFLSASQCLKGKKSRIPYDRRYGPRLKDVSPGKPGGSKQATRMVKEMIDGQPHRPGYVDKRGRFHLVPEMVPEFVVPDLTGFKLKPYVSYTVSKVTQSELTSRDLFDACYAEDIIKKFKEGKIDIDSVLEKEKKKPEPGPLPSPDDVKIF